MRLLTLCQVIMGARNHANDQTRTIMLVMDVNLCQNTAHHSDMR